jgi:hypothetical protein
MNFFFQKLRRFPEFHAVISSLETLSKSETTIVQGQGRAFAEEFRRYAKSQKGNFADALNSVCDAGSQQVKVQQEILSSLQKLPQDLQPLLAQEAEISKWREVSINADALAAKSREIAERAQANLQRAKSSGRAADIGKAESAFSAAQRKADSDQSSADDQKSSLEKKEAPFRAQFLESFVTPLSATIDVRYKAAERLLALADDFQAAAERIEDFPDPTVERFEKRLADLEAVVID